MWFDEEAEENSPLKTIFLTARKLYNTTEVSLRRPSTPNLRITATIV